jgi:transposase
MDTRFRYIILREEDTIAIEKGYKMGKTSHFRERCYALLLSHRGCTISEISSLLRKKDKTIRKWFNSFEDQGILGLEIKAGRGRKPSLDTKDERVVSEIKKKSS